MSHTVSAHDVSVTVGDLTLLSPTTFAAGPGDFMCVAGPNGSGKTTLLRAILGQVQLATGSVTVVGDSLDFSRPEHRRRVAAFVDVIPMARDLTVIEQLLMVGVSWFGREPGVVDDVNALVDELGLSALHSRFPHELSSGQLQLFRLALTLIRPGDLVILDEPERHLDDEHLGFVRSILSSRAASGTTIIAATHAGGLQVAATRMVTLG